MRRLNYIEYQSRSICLPGRTAVRHNTYRQAGAHENLLPSANDIGLAVPPIPVATRLTLFHLVTLTCPILHRLGMIPVPHHLLRPFEALHVIGLVDPMRPGRINLKRDQWDEVDQSSRQSLMARPFTYEIGKYLSLREDTLGVANVGRSERSCR